MTEPKLKTKNLLAKSRLYCITLPPNQNQTYEETVESASKGGADIIQLRDKNLMSLDFLNLAKKLHKICKYYETLFIINDRIDLALACGADGVHLGQNDLPLKEAKKIANAYLSTDFIIGCSSHSIEQALTAQKEGADYVGCGPIFSTPTKPDYPAVGLSLVRQYVKEIKIPFVAIGGIDETNVKEVVEAGSQCVAVVRAGFENRDIENAVRSLKSKINSALQR